MATPMKDRRRSSCVLASFILACLMITTFFSSPVWSQCTSCENCPPPAMGFTSKQMTCGGQQVLTVIGGKSPFVWSIISGGGSLSSKEGQSVEYTAPSSNQNCENNPTIQVTDFCGKTAMLKIAVNCYSGEDEAYKEVVCNYEKKYSCIIDGANRPVCTCERGLGNNSYKCSGVLISNTLCSYQGVLYTGFPGMTCLEACPEAGFCSGIPLCSAMPKEGCCGTLGAECDTQTEAMKTGGCCPATLSQCLNISGFSGNAPNLNLSSGQEINFTGNISSNTGGAITWTVTVAGTGWFSSGTGNSISATWDGKDASGKQVAPGTYTATLAAQTSGGTCGGGDSDIKTFPIIVKSTPEACALNADFESSVNTASGNLRHSQSLFNLPNFKILGDFSLAYNSLDASNQVLGIGWTHSYNINLSQNSDGSYTVMEGDGSDSSFTVTAAYIPLKPSIISAINCGQWDFHP